MEVSALVSSVLLTRLVKAFILLVFWKKIAFTDEVWH
jgi:hypothetical protein